MAKDISYHKQGNKVKTKRKETKKTQSTEGELEEDEDKQVA